MKEVLLICGSFKSANFNVMVDIIKAMDDNLIIHAVSTQGDNVLNNDEANNIRYYSVKNKAIAFGKKIQSLTKTNVTVVLNILRIIQESYMITSDEKRIVRFCDEIIINNDISAVFSVLFPTYAHNVAICLAKTHPSLQLFQFWFDQFSNRRRGVDSFFESAINKFFTKRIQSIERHYFESVDQIYALPETFFDNRTIENYKDKLVYFEIPYIKRRDCSFSTNNIVYAGSFLRRIREPIPVFEIIVKALPMIKNKMIFHFYVPEPALFKNYEEISGGKMVFESYINRVELEKVLSESKMLLTIGNRGITGMPSKTVEYISFRKPILFFYADDSDSSKRYLDYYPDVCAIDVRQDVNINSVKLADYINSYHTTISYDDLMSVKVFRESTPEYIRSIFKFKST